MCACVGRLHSISAVYSFSFSTNAAYSCDVIGWKANSPRTHQQQQMLVIAWYAPSIIPSIANARTWQPWMPSVLWNVRDTFCMASAIKHHLQIYSQTNPAPSMDSKKVLKKCRPMQCHCVCVCPPGLGYLYYEWKENHNFCHNYILHYMCEVYTVCAQIVLVYTVCVCVFTASK